MKPLIAIKGHFTIKPKKFKINVKKCYSTKICVNKVESFYSKTYGPY